MVLVVLGLGLCWTARAWTEPATVQDQMVGVLDSQPEKIFQLADELQNHPYGQHAMAIVSVLTRYGVASKKVTLTLGSMIQPFSATRHKDADLRLFGAYWTGLLLYAVEHEGHAGDTDGSNLFAVNYSLKTYRNMLKARPTEHNPYADKLVSLDKSGKLAAFIHHQVTVDKQHPMHVELESPSSTPSASASAPPSPESTESPSPLPGQGQSPEPSSPVPSSTATGQL
jgi:hypothetical protein